MHSGQFISSLSPSIVFALISSALISEIVPQAQFGQVARTSYRFCFAMALSFPIEVHCSTRVASRSVLHEKPRGRCFRAVSLLLPVRHTPGPRHYSDRLPGGTLLPSGRCTLAGPPRHREPPVSIPLVDRVWTQPPRVSETHVPGVKPKFVPARNRARVPEKKVIHSID
jgi:hypothetical protein